MSDGRWEIHFEGIPPNYLNSRLDKYTRRKSIREWRERAALYAWYAGVPALKHVRVSAIFTRRNLGVADQDGDICRLKPVLDGLVQAHVVPNDSRRHLELGTVTEKHGTPGFTLIIEALET